MVKEIISIRVSSKLNWCLLKECEKLKLSRSELLRLVLWEYVKDKSKYDFHKELGDYASVKYDKLLLSFRDEYSEHVLKSITFLDWVKNKLWVLWKKRTSRLNVLKWLNTMDERSRVYGVWKEFEVLKNQVSDEWDNMFELHNAFIRENYDVLKKRYDEKFRNKK